MERRFAGAGRVSQGVSGAVFLGLAASMWFAGRGRPDQLVLGVLLVLPFLLVFSMSFRISISVDEEMLQVRSYWRTHRFLLRDVVAVEVEPYVGSWTGPSHGWPHPRMLAVLRYDGRKIDLPATLGFGRRIRGLADQLNDIVSAPPEDAQLVLRDVVSNRTLRRDARKRRRKRGRL